MNNEEQMTAAPAEAIANPKPPEPQPSENSEPKPRKCLIEQMLPTNIIGLLQAAPHNLTVRAMVLARLKQPIPDDRITFDAIKEWIETTFEPKVVVRGAPVAPGQPATTVRIRCYASQTELGTARYRVRQSGEGVYNIQRSTILEIAEESEDWNDFLDGVQNYIDEREGTSKIDFSDDDEYEYSDHGIDDSEVTEFGLCSGQGPILEEILRDCSPEQAQRLIG